MPRANGIAEKNDKAEIVRFIKLIKGMNERQQSGLNVMLTGLAMMKGKEKKRCENR